MPPPLPNAILDLNGDNFVGSQRYYNCLEGFVPTKPGPIMIECMTEIVNDRGRAVWSPPSHVCSGMCIYKIHCMSVKSNKCIFY